MLSLFTISSFSSILFQDAGADQSLPEGGGNPLGGGNNDERFMHDTGAPGSVNEGVLQYVSTVAAASQPFFLVVSLVNPHDVLFYSTQFEASGYDPAMLSGDIELPETVNENLTRSDKPRVQEQFLIISQGGLGPLNTTEQKRNYVNFYGNLIKRSDAYLVEFLDALDAAGLTDDTVIIRSSDHGELAMAHGGMIQKSFNFYEESVRVPYVFSNPKIWPTPVVTDALFSHVDLLPTMSTLFGVPPSPYKKLWQGVDVSPSVLNPKKDSQDYILFQVSRKN